MLIETLYWIFFASALFSALMVVLAPHAVYNALYLVGTMASIAGLFLLMNAQLAGAFQLIVYAGAIMVLFLFVIMLLNVGHHQPSMGRNKGVRIAGLLLAAAFVVQLIALLGYVAGSRAIGVDYQLVSPPSPDVVTVGGVLQTDYIYAFAMTSVLLLVAMIGAVSMARRHLIQGADDETAGRRPNGR